MNWDGAERRRFVRGDFPCKIFIYTPEGRVISTLTENISQGGMRVTIEERLEINSIVRVESYLEEEPIIRKGKVVWVREKENLYSTGIEFYDIEDK